MTIALSAFYISPHASVKRTFVHLAEWLKFGPSPKLEMTN
jgi:hypothetical protein